MEIFDFDIADIANFTPLFESSLMGVQIKEVNNKNLLRTFINFPFSLYINSPYWVPPLIKDEWKTLYSHLASDDSKFFLAFKDGKISGRAAFIVQSDERNAQGEQIARFGWIDFIDDAEVYNILMTTGENWVLSKGCKVIQGPMGFSNLDKTAMLIEGFDKEPTIAEIYNYEYYPDYMQRHGYHKANDWISYEFEVPEAVPDRLYKYGELVKKRYRVRTVKGNLKAKKKYGMDIFRLINETHRHIHGFIPFDDELAQSYLDKYLPLVDKDLLSLIVDENDHLVGYGVAMPSFSQAFRKSKGRLFPFGYLRLWRAMRHPFKADLYLIGIADHMRNRGLIALIFQDIISSLIRKGIRVVESNPELETNQQIHQLWKNYNYTQHKRRRIFKKTL